MDEEEPRILFSYGGVQGGPRVEVTLAPDAMAAWGTFFPSSSPDGHLLVWNELSDALTNAGVVEGLLDREIQEVIFQYNTSRPASARVVLARGRPAQAERPAFLKLEAKFYNHHFQVSGDVQVDFKEFSPFVIVKKGELLARAVLPRLGIPGRTVTGKELPPERKDIKHLKPGAHTLFAHGKVFSRLAGRFTLDGEVFDVADTLDLGDGVGYTTGNLIFPGTITVKGVVSDGFRLVAGADIIVKGPLDASEVMCHGDLNVEGGIIGKKPGIVRVGKSVRCAYIENVQVESLGTISVARAILRGTIFTNEDLSMDEGGRIVSSTVWARGNVSCTQLGAENGLTKIVAGSDFVVKRKIDAIKQKYEQLEKEIDHERSRGLADNPQHREALALFVSEMNELTASLFTNTACEVRVSSKVEEGTVIEMGFASLTVVKTSKGAIYRLSPDGKSILTAPFEKMS